MSAVAAVQSSPQPSPKPERSEFIDLWKDILGKGSGGKAFYTYELPKPACSNCGEKDYHAPAHIPKYEPVTITCAHCGEQCQVEPLLYTEHAPHNYYGLPNYLNGYMCWLRGLVRRNQYYLISFPQWAVRNKFARKPSTVSLWNKELLELGLVTKPPKMPFKGKKQRVDLQIIPNWGVQPEEQRKLTERIDYALLGSSIDLQKIRYNISFSFPKEKKTCITASGNKVTPNGVSVLLTQNDQPKHLNCEELKQVPAESKRRAIGPVKQLQIQMLRQAINDHARRNQFNYRFFVLILQQLGMDHEAFGLLKKLCFHLKHKPEKFFFALESLLKGMEKPGFYFYNPVGFVLDELKANFGVASWSDYNPSQVEKPKPPVKAPPEPPPESKNEPSIRPIPQPAESEDVEEVFDEIEEPAGRIQAKTLEEIQARDQHIAEKERFITDSAQEARKNMKNQAAASLLERMARRGKEESEKK